MNGDWNTFDPLDLDLDLNLYLNLYLDLAISSPKAHSSPELVLFRIKEHGQGDFSHLNFALLDVGLEQSNGLTFSTAQDGRQNRPMLAVGFMDARRLGEVESSNDSDALRDLKVGFGHFSVARGFEQSGMKLFIQLSHLDGVFSSGRLWHEPNVAQILQQVSGTLGLAKDLDGMAFCEYPKVIELVQNLKIQLRDLPANFGA